MATGEVNAGNLQITAVDVALMERSAAIDDYFLISSAPHGIIGAFNHGAGGFVGEADGAVLCVVDGSPNTGLCLDDGLIAVGIKLRQEETLIILHNAGVTDCCPAEAIYF